MHFFIFWGFVILLSAVLEAIVEGLVPGFTLAALGPSFRPSPLLQETIGILVVLSCVVALCPLVRRSARADTSDPEITGHVRLRRHPDPLPDPDGHCIDVWRQRHPHAARRRSAARPLRLVVPLAGLFVGHRKRRCLVRDLLVGPHTGGARLSELPPATRSTCTYSPRFPTSTSRPCSRGARLSKLNLEDENAVKFGADDVTDLTWKQLLDGFTCTDCGRCTAACPANNTGKAAQPAQDHHEHPPADGRSRARSCWPGPQEQQKETRRAPAARQLRHRSRNSGPARPAGPACRNARS